MTLPGEPRDLMPNPKNQHDANAITVISPRGVQIGCVNAKRTPTSAVGLAAQGRGRHLPEPSHPPIRA